MTTLTQTVRPSIWAMGDKQQMKKNLKPEAELKHYFNEFLKPDWISENVESSILATKAGFPDKIFSLQGKHGFIEFKVKRLWPKTKHLIVKVDKFRPNQKLFLYQHGSKGGGSAFLIIKIENDVLIFDWLQSQEVGKLTKKEMFLYCSFSFPFDLMVEYVNQRVKKADIRFEIIKTLTTF